MGNIVRPMIHTVNEVVWKRELQGRRGSRGRGGREGGRVDWRVELSHCSSLLEQLNIPFESKRPSLSLSISLLHPFPSRLHTLTRIIPSQALLACGEAVSVVCLARTVIGWRGWLALCLVRGWFPLARFGLDRWYAGRTHTHVRHRRHRRHLPPRLRETLASRSQDVPRMERTNGRGRGLRPTHREI